MPNEFQQFNLENIPKTLEDYLYVKDGVIILRAPMQTENFISGKRGVQVKPEGLNTTGGTINGSTISGGSTTTTITGDLTHTGSKVGLNGNTPVAKATDIGSTSFTDVGGAFNQSTLNSNFTTAAAQINAIRTALRAIGIMT